MTYSAMEFPTIIRAARAEGPQLIQAAVVPGLVLEAAAGETEKRILAGMAVPWNEVGYTSLGPVRYLPGAIDAAARPAVDRDHDTSRIVGRVVSAESTDAGILAKARMSKTAEGNDTLVLADDGALTGFSTVVRATKYTFEETDEHGLVMVVSEGQWVRLAVVTDPAFDSARITSVAASTRKDHGTVTIAQFIAMLRGTVEASRPALLTEHHELIEASGLTDDSVMALAFPPSSAPEIEAQHVPIVDVQREPLTAYASLGDYAKAKAAGLVEAAEVVRIEAALADVTTADVAGLVRPQWVNDFAEELAAARPVIEAFDTRPLPASGLSLSYPVVTARPSVALQATQKSEVHSADYTIGSATTNVVTWAGANDLAIQAIQRSEPSMVSLYLEEMGYSLAEVSDAEVAAAILTAVTQTETLSAADVTTINAVLASAAHQVFAAKRGAVPNVMVAGLGVWEFLAGASDTEGRPLFPNLNGANPVGTISFRDTNGNVRGMDFAGTPNLADDKAIMGWKRAVTTWLGPVSTMSADQPAVLGRDVAIYQFGAYAVRRPDALVEITLGA